MMSWIAAVVAGGCLRGVVIRVSIAPGKPSGKTA